MVFDADLAIIETLKIIQSATVADTVALVPLLRHSQTLIQPFYQAGSDTAPLPDMQETIDRDMERLLHEASTTGRVACQLAGQGGWPGTIIVFPLQFKHEPCGSLAYLWYDNTQHAPDLAAAECGARTLSPFLAGALAFDANQFYVQALEYLGALSTEFNQFGTVDEVLHAAGHTACVLLDAENYAFFLNTRDGMNAVASEGINSDIIAVMKASALPLEQFQMVNIAYEQHRTLSMTTQRAGEIPPEWNAIFRSHGVHACITAKVHSNIEVFGTMWLFFHRPYVPSEYDSQLADVLAVQLAAAIQNIELITANRNHAEALERRVQERTHELAMALKKAESVDQLKTQLLSTVSHELRTPLAVIKAHSSTELAYYDRLPKERHIQYLTTINEETDRLAALINSLLDMSRLDAGALDLRPAPVEPVLLLQQLTQTLQNRYAEHVITLESPPTLGKVMADPSRLEQLMNNLVENAARAAPPQTSIQLGARAWDDALELWVKDEGSSFSKEQAQHVFDRFYLANDLMHHQSGSGIGLGLAICKGLVESMGGRIWCETDGVNHGSRFAFTVPWAAT